MGEKGKGRTTTISKAAAGTATTETTIAGAEVAENLPVEAEEKEVTEDVSDSTPSLANVANYLASVFVLN
jgi:hypothetical protein